MIFHLVETEEVSRGEDFGYQGAFFNKSYKRHFDALNARIEKQSKPPCV